jgi:hypothetical protein
MTGINAEHIMVKMDYEKVLSDAELYRAHQMSGHTMGFITTVIEKLGELLISTGESMVHYAEHHDDHHDEHHTAA